MNQHVPTSICGLRPGDHAGCVHDSEADRELAVSACVREGLRRGEKVIYVADADAAHVALRRLAADGVDPTPYLRRDQLHCLIDGRDGDPGYAMARSDWFSAHIASETAHAEAQGYAALWLVQDLTCLMRRTPNWSRVVEYERRLGEWLSGARCIAICQYDSRRCDHELLMQLMLQLHPIIMFGTDVHENRQYGPTALAPGAPLARGIETRGTPAAEPGHVEARTRTAAGKERAVDGSAEEAVLLMTLDGRILRANRAACAIFGHAADEFVDVGLMALFGGDHEALRSLLEACTRAGGAKGEVRFIRKDGTTFEGEVSGATFFHAAGQQRMSLVVRDVTRAR